MHAAVHCFYWIHVFIVLETSLRTLRCYSVIGDKPFLWSKPKFDPP